MPKTGSPGITSPLISVIIPVYNVAPYLREALDSVINQTYKNLQVLIVDDGSTDGSGEICEEYASRDSRITVIHQAHHNLSVARNTAMPLVSGEYLAFLDSDDAFHPSFMQTMLDTLLRENSDIVICSFMICYTEKKMEQSMRGAVSRSIPPGLYNRAQALDGRIDATINNEVWNKLYKRELWREIRFSPDLYASADVLASFQVFYNCNSAYVIDTPLYLYRQRPESLTAMYSTRIINSRILAMTYTSDFLRAHSPEVFSEQQIQRYDISKINTLMILCLKCPEKGDYEYLKRQIIDMVDRIGIDKYSPKIRTAYYMLRHCPWLLKYGYRAYAQIRKFVWKLGRGNGE